MLLCIKCKSYSHAECYKAFDFSVDHICGPCAGKAGVSGTNSTITKFVLKQNKSAQDHSKFAFDKMLRRVMNSILKEDFKTTQPGKEPGTDFFKIRFNMSTSYANKVLLHLVQMGYIKFFGGYEADEKRIREFLYQEESVQKKKPENGERTTKTGTPDSKKEHDISDEESIQGPRQTPKVTDYSERSSQNEDMPIIDISEDEPRKTTKNNGVGAKNRKKPIIMSPHCYKKQELEVFVNTGDSKEIEGHGDKPTKNNENGARSTRKKITFSPHKYEDHNDGVLNNMDNGEDLEEMLPEDKGEAGCSYNPDYKDTYSNVFKKHFIFPTRFLERETRKENEPIEAMEVSEIGKNSKRAFFGQILESAGPRLNSSEQVGYNLVFSVGKNGESIQVWSFGTETEIKELSKCIVVDSYMVFWSYEIQPKTTNKIPTTSDWIVKLSPKNRNFGVVNVTRKYTDETKANGELLEKFSEKFSTPTLKKPIKKRKELTFKEKNNIKLDSLQPKIDKFLQISDDRIVLSTSSFDSSGSSRRLRSSSKTPRQSSSSPIPSGSTISPDNRTSRSRTTQSSRKRRVSNSTGSSSPAKTRSRRNFNYNSSESTD